MLRKFSASKVVAALVFAPAALLALPAIQVSTVPWVASSPATPHFSWSGHGIALKGTANVQDTGSGTIMYTWDPGDGSGVNGCGGAHVVTNQFIIECAYTYSGPVNSLFPATLTVWDSSNPSNTASAQYYTELYAYNPGVVNSLQTETNAAIDAGLWQLHKQMTRSTQGAVTAVTLTNGGGGYESDGVTAPVVTISGCATAPQVTAVVDNGSPTVNGPGVITSLVLNSPGTNCTSPTVTITDPLQANGGKIISFNVTNQGTGGILYYGSSSPPGSIYGAYTYVTFTGAGNTGSGAYGYFYVTPDLSTSSFSLYNAGSGYVNPVTVNYTDYWPIYGYGATWVADTYYEPNGGLTGFQATATASADTFGSGASATATLGSPVNLGDWSGALGNATAGSGGIPVSGVTAANCTAFEVSGHLELGPASDPYTDDVARCILGIFSRLTSTPISNVTNGIGTFNPDQNGNGIGVHITESNDQYQDGMVMDALVATGEKNTPVTYGALGGLTHPGGGGPYTYQDAVFDMTDYYSYCQSTTGAWIYTCQSGNDNSVSQWAGIGLIAARRNFNSALNQDNLLENQQWLVQSQNAGFLSATGGGWFGYDSNQGVGWGPYADTPSGMVQLALSGIGRSPTGASNPTQWDWAETYMRDNFDNGPSGCATCDVKDYYYGMFSFTKSMLLHDTSGTGLGNTPIQYLQSLDNAGTYPPIDWYAAQNAAWGGSDTSNGVARTLITSQNGDGSWWGHNYDQEQYYFETAWAVIMLNHTVFQLNPGACATYSPDPATDGASVQLNGQCSTEPNPAPAAITTWQWDISGNANGAVYALSGVKVNTILTAPASCVTFPCNFPVRLHVTDSLGLTGDTVFNVVLNNSPTDAPPSANAGGPYNFCPNLNLAGAPIYVPWLLDASHSSESGSADTIVAYDWDFSCSGAYNSAHGVQPRVDTGSPNLFNHAPGTFNVCLRVTNNSTFVQDQVGLASAQVTVHNATDDQCNHCVQTQSAKAKNFAPNSPGDAQIYWIDTNSAGFPIDHYNIYRSTNANFSSFIQVAGANSSNPAIPAIHAGAGGEQLNWIDPTIPAPSTTPYYYRIAPATAADVETCTSPTTISVIVGGRK